ncbi:hypothetical protein PCASD_10325 [Puccinia coronata f. sp. avenae]|uniref:Uncharacterized protein n=1 Tax=Puccinia coronata f. sp. avenae TaxID=200324 RepID=A0A2N5UKW6_9BASI|nr:hypothetical protein PCASD_10325 [Puccinia coronata f. sp. avenae]
MRCGSSASGQLIAMGKPIAQYPQTRSRRSVSSQSALARLIRRGTRGCTGGCRHPANQNITRQSGWQPLAIEPASLWVRRKLRVTRQDRTSGHDFRVHFPSSPDPQRIRMAASHTKKEKEKAENHNTCVQ